FASAIDSGVSAADHSHARAQLHFRGTHADIAQKRKSVEDAHLVFAFSLHTVRLGEANRQHTGVVVLFQIVPAHIFADFDAGFNLDSELFEPFDFAIEDILRKNPVRNAAAVES